jgi:hypothetical protein
MGGGCVALQNITILGDTMMKFVLAPVVFVWAAATAAAQSFPPGVVYAQVNYASGSIVSGGQAQHISWALPGAKMRCVQNPNSAAEDLFVAFGGIASTASQDLPPGAQVCWPWNGAVSIYGATAGHAFIAVEAQ